MTKLTVTEVTRRDVEVTDAEIASALMQIAAQRTRIEDDAGCQWGTFGGSTFIADGSWRVSVDEHVARIVDVANILAHGCRYVLDAKTDTVQPEEV